ncbi:MAG: class II aldolase/adducin family protein [Syntrophorhabdaceae bacterium]|nr:class II aldolase/adducin family protein [Syntrophorhabdaceae bacterium]
MGKANLPQGLLIADAVEFDRFIIRMDAIITNEPDMELRKAVDELVRIARRSAVMGLSAGAGGNISSRCGARVLIKASGCSLYDLCEENVVVLGENGEVLSGGGSPSKEVRFHLGIYRSLPETGGVAHYHAPYCTAFAIKGMPVPLVTINAKRYFSKMPIVPELPDGSPELADAVVEAFQDKEVRLILLAGHGIVSVGHTLTEAHLLAESAEEAARIAFFSRFL